MATVKAAANPPAKKRPGRPRLVENGDLVQITCKVPEELRDEFNQLGGSEWLRDLLTKSRAKRTKAKTHAT